MKSTKKYSRKSTSITISLFYEQFQLEKYNMNPPYQRDDNVWSDEQKSFLIDTILKNFPMPPIFVEQKINSKTGKTTYDVIDGKQRLTAIVNFISDKVTLPINFGKDDYGNPALNGKTFAEIMKLATNDDNIESFISDFWAYVISVEYIEKPDVKVVDNIFDRLNREGTRLNPAELRKANYYDTALYNSITSLRNDTILEEILDRLSKNRLQDVSFITELYLMLIQNKIIDGVEATIDTYFEDVVESIDTEKAYTLSQNVMKIARIVKDFNLNYDKYRIRGVSHLYAIFFIAYFLDKNNIQITHSFNDKLYAFYSDLRGEQIDENVRTYHKSMQSASRYSSSRKKRVKALLDYLEIRYDDTTL